MRIVREPERTGNILSKLGPRVKSKKGQHPLLAQREFDYASATHQLETAEEPKRCSRRRRTFATFRRRCSHCPLHTDSNSPPEPPQESLHRLPKVLARSHMSNRGRRRARTSQFWARFPACSPLVKPLRSKNCTICSQTSALAQAEGTGPGQDRKACRSVAGRSVAGDNNQKVRGRVFISLVFISLE